MASQQRSRARSKRLALVAATVAASAALATGPGFAAGVVRAAGAPAPTPAPGVIQPATGPASDDNTPVPQIPPVPERPAASPAASPAAVGAAPASPSAAPSASPSASPQSAGKASAFGAYLDYGARGVSRIAQLSEWLGGAELRVGHTYLPGDRWSNIEGANGFLDVWADWRREKADRMLVLNVPMQENNEGRVSDDDVRSLLRRGAAGDFDQHFRALAERLVDLKVPDTVIVLGWEMNGTTYTHRCGPDPAAWKTYWNRIVTTMRAVPGQKFQFDFAPTRGRDAVPWTECYPGDDVVDIVGMDSYDQPSGRSFDEQIKEPYGLQQQVDFAKAHGKEISYPEWGLFNNGDNPDYMRRMLQWMDDHHPLYNTLTDYCPHGVWQCAQNPQAAKVYRSVLYGRTDDPNPNPTPVPTPTPTPTPTPKPTEPAAPKPPANCSRLDLGDWVEYWLGGKLCVRLDWWSRDN